MPSGAARASRLVISDFTSDPPSVIPLPTALPIRAEHDTYPVSVAVGPSTKKVDTDAPPFELMADGC